jgi:hypothetical protein
VDSAPLLGINKPGFLPGRLPDLKNGRNQTQVLATADSLATTVQSCGPAHVSQRHLLRDSDEKSQYLVPGILYPFEIDLDKHLLEGY